MTLIHSAHRLQRSPRTEDDALLRDLRAWGGPSSVVESELERRTTAHDASHYLLQPRAVVRPGSVAGMGELFRVLDRHGLGLTFRSGGTSLSGQSVSDQVLVDTRRNFRNIEVLDGGRRVRVQPGATVRQVNQRLAQYGRKLGPDPASEAACTIGGVVANNSSGMHCGTEFNTYQTLESMTFVTPSGTVVNTADVGADSIFREREPELHAGLIGLRRRVVENAASVRTLRHQFSMKNTMGYGLNAFLDFEEPVRILEHLLIGSEGTLGFVAEAVFHTVEVMPKVATGLLVFPDLISATSIVPDLVDARSATVELLDSTSLRMAQRSGQAPARMAEINVQEHAALLVEYQGRDDQELRDRTAEAERLFASLNLSTPATLTDVSGERAALWKVRKGLYATVAGSRPSGSNALLEDIVVPVAVLGETCQELTRLFESHAYEDSVIFGHAKDGNVHFMLNENFEDSVCLGRYEQFTEEMVQLVLERGGSLKAEHGTGRIMAPYVRRQYGDELYEVMCQLKALVDPRNAFNPGVVLSDDPRSYLNHLKTAPTVEEEVDRCVECGYCEPVCPSKDLTLTPRQRIVGRREIEAAEANGDHELAMRLRKEYDYEGLQTCAVDGMCATACPVSINTGDLVRRLRAENHSVLADRVWGAAASVWETTTRVAGLGLSLANALPPMLPRAVTQVGRAVLGDEHVPQYQNLLPGGGRPRPSRRDEAATAVFFPACVSGMFGTPDGTGLSVSEAFLALCERAGVAITIPDRIGSACCGTPWKSKGLPSGYRTMAPRTLSMLWEASDHGRLPVVCDASSCTEGLAAMRDLALTSPEYSMLRFVDSVEFIADNVLSRLNVTRPLDSMALHPTCSSIHLGITDALETVARAVASKVVLPQEWSCCAYAGDRGMLHPELTASATAAEAAEINSGQYDAYASLNRTCEQGMTEATGRPYWHVLQYLEKATRSG
ncbi:FAD-binding and (Fe-S)-binding domain-containing protein [Arthrobacter sp. ISL-30]|uniref:FAD-binding and (Fe-S)-binding domain-containing protein n=1 Tax=Arthrobacter sp. ISL-30 TaxID=2819109 RepID=UPI001BEB43F6|nr:FAD-binding and (Fe-S)-binding domain-containing protein [Arthrobacter sp. ISL-30]MBT2514727.1 FAD-binding oxidoreductase [Arthrobacter sp. ISL-30]